MAVDRLLPVELVPKSLWISGPLGTHRLRLPTILAETYGQVLTELGFFERRLQSRRAEGGPIGGASAEEADDHFVSRFDGACARMALAILDPGSNLRDTSDRLVRLLAGGKLRIMDVPCGAGAASLSLLASTYQLRAEGVLPRIPLSVDVVAGDLSDRARELGERMVERLHPQLELQSVHLQYRCDRWNAGSTRDTVRLLHRALSVESGETGNDVPCLVVLSNFSGYLSRSFDQCKDDLRTILRLAGEAEWPVLWVEPRMKDGAKKTGVLARLWRMVREIFRLKTDSCDTVKADCTMQDPLAPGNEVNVHTELAWLDRDWEAVSGQGPVDAA